MDNLPFEALLELGAGWSPPKNEFQAGRSRWQTWPQFMADWLAVRDEYLEHRQWGNGEVFAESVFRVFGAKGPPAHYGYIEVRDALAAAEDEAAAELLADIKI